MLSNLVSRYFHEVITNCYIDRYHVIVVPKSGIKNDPNDWAEEVESPRYIVDFLLCIIIVSVKTIEIVDTLSPFEFDS